jgi:hypothetical protein
MSLQPDAETYTLFYADFCFFNNSSITKWEDE